MNKISSLFLNDEINNEELDNKPSQILKVVNKIVECKFEKCIKGTCEYIPNFHNNLIQDIIFKEKNIHKRIFYKNINEVGYIEVIKDPSLAYAHETCEHITFLFECREEDNIAINGNKCFGFRYYNHLNNKYCTLLKENEDNEDDYFFLENLEKINNEKNLFFKPNLDCFEIIFDCIFSKYKKVNNEFKDFPLILESPIYEIIGFYYSVLSKSTEYFKFHKIHSINILNDIDFTSNIKRNNNELILNIMPLLFDGHISILFFIDYDEMRHFILSDPGHIHFKSNGDNCIIDPFIFPPDMRKNLDLFPKQKIQKYNSCSLWFYFQILTLINYNNDIQSKKYVNAEDFVKYIEDSQFYFDCLNYYIFIMGFEKKLIEIKPKTLFEEEDCFYVVQKNAKYLDNLKINIFSFLNQFIDIIKIIKLLACQDLSSKPGLRQLNSFMEDNEEFIDFISLLNYNFNFFYLNIQKDDITPKIFESLIDQIEDIRDNFIGNCLEFLLELSKISKSVKSLVSYSSEEANKAKENGNSLEQILEIINGNIEEFIKRKNIIENEYTLYPLRIIGQKLFPILGVLYRSK